MITIASSASRRGRRLAARSLNRVSTILIFIWIVLICSGCYSYTNLSREALQYEDSTALGEIVRVVLVDSTQIRFKSEPMPPEYVPYCEVLYGHDSIGEAPAGAICPQVSQTSPVTAASKPGRHRLRPPHDLHTSVIPSQFHLLHQ